MTHDRTAVLLIRVWLEDEPPELRARITGRSDARKDSETVTFAVSVNEVTGAVSSWLRAFLTEPDAHRSP